MIHCTFYHRMKFFSFFWLLFINKSYKKVFIDQYINDIQFLNNFVDKLYNTFANYQREGMGYKN